MIITRYLTREIVKNALSICFILTLIVFCNRVVWFLTRLAGGSEQWQGIIFQAALLWLPQLLTLLLPLGISFGVLLTLNRFHAHHEIEAIYAGGFQERVWITRLFLIGTMSALFVGFFSLWLAPTALSYQKELAAQNRVFLTKILFTPGQFQMIPGTSSIVYVTIPNETHAFSQDILIVNPTQKTKTGEIDLILAKKATQSSSPLGEDFLTISLFQGSRYQGVPGTMQFTITQFDTFILNPRLPETTRGSYRENELPTLQLFKTKEDKAEGELAWRISLPIMTLILVLLTFPLYRPKAKQERLGTLFLTIFMILLYPNLLLLIRPWSDQTTHGPFLWMGMMHLIFLLIVCYFIFLKKNT